MRGVAWQQELTHSSGRGPEQQHMPATRATWLALERWMGATACYLAETGGNTREAGPHPLCPASSNLPVAMAPSLLLLCALPSLAPRYLLFPLGTSPAASRRFVYGTMCQGSAPSPSRDTRCAFPDCNTEPIPTGPCIPNSTLPYHLTWRQALASPGALTNCRIAVHRLFTSAPCCLPSLPRCAQSGVSCLRFQTGGAGGGGSLLASGGRDTDVIVWDVVGETGLYRLRGHKDQVTDLVSWGRE